MSAESHTQHAHDRGNRGVTAQDASTADGSGPLSRAEALPNEGAAENVVNTRHRALAGGALLLAGVALASANMRPAVTSLSSILGEVRDSVGASSTWASVVTAVPTLCFGVAALAAPVLSRRWGMNPVVGGSLALLTVSLVVRVLGGSWVLLGGTVLACVAIAMCNVLIPVVVKESFPNRVGAATGLYTTALAAGSAAGSAVTPWLDSLVGSWRLALATWMVLALAALLVWVPGSRRTGRTVAAAEPGTGMRSMLRSPLAWLVTGYFGLQSTTAYIVMGWLPEVFKGAGMDATTVGVLMGVLLLVGVPINMVLPPLVTRTRGQSWWAVLMGVPPLAGVLGLLLAPLAAPLLWALLIGVSVSAISLALALISLRTTNAADTGQLSAMSQSIGYVVASVGPFLFGVLHEITGSWSASLTAVLGFITAQTVIGFLAGRPRTI